MSLEEQRSLILLGVFIKSKPEGNINVKQFNTAEEISEKGRSDGQEITKSLTALNLIMGRGPHTYEDRLFFFF